MVAVTQLVFTGLSIFAMVQKSIAAPIAVESDSLAVSVRDISEGVSDGIFYDKRSTGALPKPILKAGRAALKLGSKLPGKKYIKAALHGGINKAIKVEEKAHRAKVAIKNKIGRGKRDLNEYSDLEVRDIEELTDIITREIIDNWDAEVFQGKRATGKLPKPILKAGRAAMKLGSKLPGKKHIKAALHGGINKAVKASNKATKAKISIKKKIGKGKRGFEEAYDFEARDFDDEAWE